jgi:hypothetical protein
VLVLDPTDLHVTDGATLPGPVVGMAAADGGRIFLAYRNSRDAEVYAVDVGRKKAEGGWSVRLPGGLRLALHPDQRGFFLGNSAVAGRRVLSARLRGDLRRPAEVVGEARSDADGVLGGNLYLTPDGRFLADSGGKIYRTGIN